MFLQEIRARQAYAEAGIEVTSITIDHATPRTIVNGVTRPLLFPRRILDFRQEKSIEVLFLGYIHPRRKPFLDKFPNATIIHSNRGRDKRVKAFDESYFSMMGKARFVLAPNGDYVWTYRFYEAILTGGIPVVQEVCSIYQGYKFYRPGDTLLYDEEIVVWNLAKVEEMMLQLGGYPILGT